MNILIEHPNLGPQETRLSADVAAAATSCTVENNTSFATNDYVVFGVPGEELTEIVLLTSTTGTTTLGHTTGPVFAHSARTPVSQIKYNQAQIHRATTEDGTYSLIATVDLTLDDTVTTYDDTAGTTASWYKIKYYNETTAALSSFSVAVQGTGYTEDSLRDMTDEVLEDFGDPTAKDLSRDQVANYLKSGVRKLTNQIYTYYPDYLRTYTTQDLTSGTATYSLPTGFLGFLRVDVNIDGQVATDAFKAEYIEEDFGEADTTYYEADPYVTIRGSNFVIRPTPTGSGRAYMWYWAYPTVMSTEATEHGLPYGARDVLINYALYRAWLTKDKENTALYKSLYKDSLKEYMDFLAQGRQKISSPKVDVIFATDLYDW